MRSLSPRARVALSVVFLAVLAACGPARQTALPGTGPETGPETQHESPPASGPASDTPTSTAEVEVDRAGIEPAVVTAVRYAAHETYDRLVIDLKGAIPGYSVKWVDEFVQDGSGKPIDVRGGAYLQVTLFPANAHDDEGAPTWHGGPVYAADLGNLTDVVRTGDFEGRVGIGLALDKQAPFQVKEQGTPNRLIVDVAH